MPAMGLRCLEPKSSEECKHLTPLEINQTPVTILVC